MDVIKDIDHLVEYDLAMYINKLDPIKALNKITYNLSLSQSELHTINKNQRDVDVINKSSEDAKNLRKKIQIANEEIYSTNIIFTFYSSNLEKIFKIISAFKAKLYSKQIISEVTNFRHLEFYLSNLPLNIRSKYLKNNLYITTSALANIYPFYATNIIDISGVLLGYTKNDRRVCILDIFSNKYENPNMCIFGSSGTGKSYFTKLFILRNFFKGRMQIILDIEKEYSALVNNLEGYEISSNSYYNILQIKKEESTKDNFLALKIDHVVDVFKKLAVVKNVDIDIMKKELKELYNEFNITDDVDTIILKQEGDTIDLEEQIIPKEEFPTLRDWLRYTKNESIEKMLKDNIDGVLNFFSNTTNIDMNNSLYSISNKEILGNGLIVKYILEYVLEENLGEKQTIIYIDEVWKYTKNEEILSSITNMYKTIRKRNGAIVTITQDIADFFTYKDGRYAKGVLNNSTFKFVFRLNYEDSQIYSKILNTSKEDFSQLKKGEAYLSVANNNLPLVIIPSNFERKILNEDDSFCK